MKHTLTRTGNRPLSFDGEMLASTNTQTANGAGENRWWDIAIYRTESGKYVLAIGYNTRWQGEHERQDAYICANVNDAAETLRDHPWDHSVAGYARDQAKQAYLMNTLRACWEHGVTMVLSVVEAEEI